MILDEHGPQYCINSLTSVRLLTASGSLIGYISDRAEGFGMPHEANNLNHQLDEIDSIQGELDSSERQTTAIRERLREAHRELRRIVNSGAKTASEE